MIPKKIFVRAKDDFTMCDGNKNIVCKVSEGEVFEAFLYKETDEYFFKNKSNGEMIFAGEINEHSCLILSEEFDLYFREV